MRLNRLFSLGCLSLFAIAAGCSLNLPSDAELAAVGEAAQEAVANAVADPLGANPFPVLVGGDEQRVYYATGLADLRFEFDDVTNDIVVPGLWGPSNLYKFEDRERELVVPLIPGGAYNGLATDGRFVAYIHVPDFIDLGNAVLHVFDLNYLSDRVVFENSESRYLLNPGSHAVDGGRIAFSYFDDGGSHLRVADLFGDEPAIEFESPSEFAGGFALRGNRLAYVRTGSDQSIAVVLVDLSSGVETTLASDVHVESVWEVSVVLSDNGVVWSEPSLEGSSRIMRYDVPTATATVWADGVAGVLTGATDGASVTEEYVYRGPDRRDQIVVRKYEGAGRVKELATFRAEGLAGQSRVIGNNAVWVNDDREIVLAPLAGGNRTSFRPF